MHENRSYTVGEIAAIFGITVRTLHHWHEIGLLTPTTRKTGNTRIYQSAEIERAHHILVYKAAGFTLTEIATILDNPNINLHEHLNKQRKLLLQKQTTLQEMITAIDKLSEETKMNNQNISSVWGNEYEAEAQELYGNTEDWKIYKHRQNTKSKSDWQTAQQAVEQLDKKLATAFKAGVDPQSAQAHTLAEEHRTIMSAWFPITHIKHCLIARGYTEDERFKKYYDKHAPGLAQWLREAIEANAEANGVDLATIR